jgi:hypothetical protein
MCEILTLWLLCQKMGDIVERKGYGSLFFKLGVVGVWFFGGFFGATIGFVLAGASRSAPSVIAFQVYGLYFVTALVCTGVLFFVAMILPEKRDRDYMDDYFKHRQKGQGKKRDEDDDDRPRRSRKGYDDSDRPRRSGDYDDRDRPRRRDSEYDDRDRPRRDDDRVRPRHDDYDDRDRPRRRDDY